MANTTFSGPVRSEAGFQVATKNATTGAVTTRMSSGMPDLTGLAKADVATGAGFAFAADTITIVNYTGAAAASATGSVIESRAGGEADIDISTAGETQLVFTAANAATNLLTTGSMIAFICYETGTWHIATKLGGADDATTGAFAFAA